MKEIYERNLAALKDKYIEIYDKIKELEKESDKDDRIIIDKSVKGENILAVKSGEGLVYLNSRYNDDEMAENWVEQYKKKNAYNVYIIFGTSNFTHINKLLKYITDTNTLLLYEPDIEIFFKNIQVNDISEIIYREVIVLCVKGANDGYLTEFILFALKYSTINVTRYCCMQNYNLLYMEDWLEIVRYIKDRFNSILMSRNTEIFFSGEFVVNFIANSRDFVSQYSLNQLRDAVEKNEINQVPVIIVSAGPSLDKNIEELKKAKDKAMIIGVDTSLKTLLNHDIIPDIVVTVDSHKPPILFMHTKFKNIPLIVCAQSNKQLFHICNGKRFYFDDENSYMSGLYKSITGERLQPTESGGSVANNAFSVANVLGFTDIILVGQDLAYTGKKMHTGDAYGATGDDVVNENGREYFEVEDIYGGKVLTEDNMNLYRKWFEEQILRYEKLKVIDATEGGAKIKGTAIMTLKEAIELKCNKKVNVKEVISNIQPQFTDEQQQQLMKRIDNISEELSEIEKKIKKGIRNYERVAELGRKNKNHTKEFKKLVKEIGELAEYIEKSPELDLVSLYNRQTEYGVLGKVFEVKDNKHDEIKDITENGIRMLKSYIDGMKELNKDIKKVKNVEKKDFDTICHDLCDSISDIKYCCDNREYDKIDKNVKSFYEYILKLIDAVDILNRSGAAEKYSQGYYEQLLKQLTQIVKSYEDKDYHEYVSLLIQLNNDVKMIGEFYYGL